MAACQLGQGCLEQLIKSNLRGLQTPQRLVQKHPWAVNFFRGLRDAPKAKGLLRRTSHKAILVLSFFFSHPDLPVVRGQQRILTS